MRPLLQLAAALGLASVAPAQTPPGPDWVVPSGTTEFYEPQAAALVLNSLVIETGATLRIQGELPFRLRAGSVRIEGELWADGLDDLLVSSMPKFPVLGSLCCWLLVCRMVS